MTKKCVVRIMNEVDVYVGGLTPEHYQLMHNTFCARVKGYIFNPRYKLGQWDGKKRYFSEQGLTKLYLIDEVLSLIVKLGYAPSIEDRRACGLDYPNPVAADVFDHVLHPLSGQPIELRDYQLTGINELIAHGYGIFIACTGAGKTLTCAALVNSYGIIGHRTITIVPSQDLIQQTLADYRMCGLDAGEYSGLKKEYDNTHIVSTWQALQHNLTFIEQFSVVLVDECHGARGNQMQKLLIEHASKIPFRFGVTGTLPTDEVEAMDVKVALGPIRHTVTAAELMERGILASLHIQMCQLEEDLQHQYREFCSNECLGKIPSYDEFKDGYFPDFQSEKAFLHATEDRTTWIAEYIIKQKGNTICFVDSIPFGRKLAQKIPGSIFVNGQDVKKAKDRKAIYDMFGDRDDMKVIATVNIAGTGLNIPRIFNLVLVDIGKSFIRVIQAIGRGLRTSSDKQSLEVTDLSSDMKYSKKHALQRFKYYKSACYKTTKRKLKYTEQDVNI